MPKDILNTHRVIRAVEEFPVSASNCTVEKIICPCGPLPIELLMPFAYKLKIDTIDSWHRSQNVDFLFAAYIVSSVITVVIVVIVIVLTTYYAKRAIKSRLDGEKSNEDGDVEVRRSSHNESSKKE